MPPLPPNLIPNSQIRCHNCRLHLNLCICSKLSPLLLKTHVSLLIHQKELKLASNTGHYLIKKLSNSSLTLWGGREQYSFQPAKLIKNDHENFVLFPFSGVTELNSEFIQTLSKPINLIVPDGTWPQASKLLRHESFFHTIKKVTLPEGRPSRYFLRQAPHAGQICTFEAVARALGIIENSNVQEELEKLFESVISRNLWERGRLTTQEFLSAYTC